MREILFRGKCVDNREWVYGNLIASDDAVEGYESIIVPKVKSDMFTREAESELGICKWNIVDPKTVCEYIGLPDKNGNKIFEGDIISTPKYGIDNGKGQNFSGKDKFVVRYADGTYYLENKLRKFCLRPDNTCEVIGNIFDDAELLGGTE